MNRQQENYWEQQKDGKWKVLTSPLKNNSEIKSHLDNFITTFYWNFREKKGVKKGTYNPEINFQGFSGFEDYAEEESKMGHCQSGVNIKWQELNGKKIEGSETYEGEISISLSQKLLLDKLGMDKHFVSETRFFSVGFDELIGTIAHELAHAFQNTIRVNSEEEVKSQCESSGDKNKYPELVAEHTTLTSEIKNLIESSAEYQSFKKRWRENKEQKIQSQNNSNDKSKKLDDQSEDSASRTKCRECQKGISLGNKMYYDFDGNKYCEGCGKTKQQEISNHKCSGCGIELGKLSDNHDTDTCFKINNELKLKKQFEENMDKFRKTQKDLKEFENRFSCPGGCGRKVKKNEICSFEDCVHQRGYRHLDESGLNFVKCSECGALHSQDNRKGASSIYKHCANCQKTTAWKNAKVKFNEAGEYQITDYNVKPKGLSPFAEWMLIGGITLLLLALTIGFVFWLRKRKSRKEEV